MEVSYLDHMGGDLSVVNAARVSFGKRKEVFDERDVRLIKYLVTHGHVLPFRHPQVSFHFKAPVFVSRQLVKHQVGMSWSEISRRYVTENPEFYWPETWRAAAPDKKQGSLDSEVQFADKVQRYMEEAQRYSVAAYNVALNAGVAPEQARMVLPQNMIAEWYWTGSLLAWAQVWRLRVAKDAQKETRDCVAQIGPTMERLFPVSWSALIGGFDAEAN